MVVIGTGVRLHDSAAYAVASAREGLSDIDAEVQAEQAARGAAGPTVAGAAADAAAGMAAMAAMT